MVCGCGAAWSLAQGSRRRRRICCWRIAGAACAHHFLPPLCFSFLASVAHFRCFNERICWKMEEILLLLLFLLSEWWPFGVEKPFFSFSFSSFPFFRFFFFFIFFHSSFLSHLCYYTAVEEVVGWSSLLDCLTTWVGQLLSWPQP